MVSGFCASGGLTLLVFMVAGQPSLAIIVLLGAVLGATVLDGAGNVPFLRAVRTHERSEMTGVFFTHRDTAQLAAPRFVRRAAAGLRTAGGVRRGRSLDAARRWPVSLHTETHVGTAG